MSFTTHVLKSYPPGLQNGTLFGNRVTAESSKGQQWSGSFYRPGVCLIYGEQMLGPFS